MECEICKKGPSQGYNKPNSQHKTKRTIRPNIQKIQGKKICTGCLRTISKSSLKNN